MNRPASIAALLPAPRRPAPAWLACALAVLAALLAGCGGPPRLETTYGRASGARESLSVNGTAVLAEMFEESGDRASSWRKLSPRLEKCDVIVWAPDNREAPSQEVCEWLEDWLDNKPGRTLVYIGRDYDAEIEYWQAMRAGAPADQALVIQSRLAKAISERDAARSQQVTASACDWFTIKRELTDTQIERLRGPWARELDLDPTAADLRLATRVDTAERQSNSTHYWHGELERRSLLYGGSDQVLVSRLARPYWNGSQIIVVDNGCFLLNLPLVNPERRKLAALLVQECGPPGQQVVFLETGPADPRIGTDADDRRPSGMEAFLVWPINVLMMHLGALGILFVVAMFPIFGRPHEPRKETVSDFGKHIHALGELLQRTGDQAYARQQLRHYHDFVRRESGVSHRQ